MSEPQCGICIYEHTPAGLVLRLVHPRCPQHGTGGHWRPV